MKPVRATDLANVAPVDGRGHGRTRQVELVISERNALIRAAAKFYPGLSDRECARRLRSALLQYQTTRWCRDREFYICPAQHKGKLMEVLFLLLRTHDHVPSIPTIRRVLGVVVSHEV